MREAKIIPMRRKTSDPCPEGMIDSRKIKQVPLQGPLHQMLMMASSAVTGLPLETVHAIELYKATLRDAMLELNRETHIGIPAIFDVTQDVIKELSQEIQP